MIVIVSLQSHVVDNGIALDVGGVCAIFHNHRRPVEVDAVVDHQQRIVVVDDVVVHTDTIQVLLQQVFEEEILLLKSSLLLLDGEFVKVHLVVTLVEVVKLLEFVVGVRVDSDDLVDLLVRLLLGIWVRLVEREDLFFFSLKLAAQFCRLEDALAKSLVATKRLHTVQTVGSQRAKMLLFLAAKLRHLFLEVMIVLHDSVALTLESCIPVITLTLDLSSFECKSLSLLLDAIDLRLHVSDGFGRLLVVVEQLRVEESLRLCLVHVLLERDLEGIVKVVDLFDQVHLHGFLLLNVLISRLLFFGEEVVLDHAEFADLFFFDGLDHLSELLSLGIVSSGDIRLLAVIFFLQNADISLEFFVKASHARLLEGNQVIDVNKMVSESHLVLLLGLIEVTIEHLKNGILCIDLSIMILLVDLNLLLECLGLGQTEPLTPLSQDFHPIQVRQALFFNHLSLEVVSTLAHELLLLLEVGKGLLRVSDSDHLATGFLSHDLAFYELS